jgi:hypothetical protein
MTALPARPIVPAAVRDAPGPANRPSFAASFAAVFSGQFARARVAAIAIFLAATLQSVGLVVLLKGLIDSGNAVTRQSVVAGSSVTVVSFVALNLLAQRFGALKASGALDYFGALPVQPAAVAGDVSRPRPGPPAARRGASSACRRAVDLRGRRFRRIVQTIAELDDDQCRSGHLHRGMRAGPGGLDVGVSPCRQRTLSTAAR